MTTAEARTLAQSDPVPSVHVKWIDAVTAAKKHLVGLVRELGHIDDLADILSEHDIKVSVDLGPIGNAAAAARRDLEKQRDTPTFELPR